MHAQRFRVSTLMSFVAVVGLSLPTISAAQPQDVADASAPAVTQSKARQGRVMTPSSSVAHAGDKGRLAGNRSKPSRRGHRPAASGEVR